MPRLTLPPEQQQQLAEAVASLRVQERLVRRLAEFAVAGLNSARWKQARLTGVTPDGYVEYEELEGPKLVEDEQEEPPEAA